MHLDMVQSKRACLHESAQPQSAHKWVFDMLRWWRTSMDGIECCVNRHRKTLRFDGTLVCHRLVQALSLVLMSAAPAFLSNQFSWWCFMFITILFVDLTENLPLLSPAQAQKSSTALVHEGSAMIASTSKVINVDCISSSLHDAVVVSISSVTSLGGFTEIDGIGRIGPTLGSQLVSQILIVLPSLTCLMIPYFKTSLPSITACQICEGWFLTELEGNNCLGSRPI